MRILFQLQVVFLTVFFSAVTFADPILRGATLPSARTVARDQIATAFFTVLNSGDTDATNCSVATSTFVGSELDEYVITSQLFESGAVTGPQNPTFSIPASGRRDFVVGIARDPAFGFNTDAYVNFFVRCDGGVFSLAWPDVNQVHAQFRDNAPDIIMITDTISRDGIANYNGNRTALVAVAAVNIGSGTTAEDGGVSTPSLNEAAIALAIDSSFDDLPADVSACPLDNSGACSVQFTPCDWNPNGACLNTEIGDSPAFFGIRVNIPGEYGGVLAPNTNRVEPIIRSPSTFSRAGSSVALGTANLVETVTPEQFMGGQYHLVVRNTGEAEGQTVNVGNAVFLENGTGLLEVIRPIDRGFFVELVSQYAVFEHAASEAGRAITQIAMLDTRGGDDSRPNDHYVVDGGRLSCDIIPAAGGRCTALDGAGEQIAGEANLFDAGEPFMLDLSPDARATRSETFPTTVSTLRTLNFVSITGSNGMTFQQVGSRLALQRDGFASRRFQMDIDGCRVEIQLRNEGLSTVGANIFLDATRHVAILYVPENEEDCPPGHPLRRIALAEGTLGQDGYKLEIAALHEPADAAGLQAAYRFVFADDPLDPNGTTRSFRLVLERPS